VIPYSTQNITEQDLAAVREALTSGWLTQGPAVPRFEARIAALHQVAHAVAVSNATAALHIACLALGVGLGKRVWTSPNSFLASANCALYCGADVDFVDIDPRTRNLSIRELEARLVKAEARGELPHLVIPVDFSGLACDYFELRQLADRFGFRILEDGSHAVGATYRSAPLASKYVDAAVFSFHAVKIVTTAEGGAVVTQDAEIARQVRMLRTHGMTRDPKQFTGVADGPWYYEQQVLGYNYRMTDVQAALGCAQLDRLDSLRDGRRRLARRYDELLAQLPLLLPARLADRESAMHLYVIEVDETRTRVTRGELFAALRAADIGVNVHYIPIHLQPYYRERGFKRGDFPASEHYYSRALSIPLFPAMTDAQQDEVVEVLRRELSA
jgi:UDP-4-amino-4,6-dideoxy-N-acetyl-beta-L-altrosamine transaminase